MTGSGPTTRRSVLAGAGALGAAAVLAGCGGGGSGDSSSGTSGPVQARTSDIPIGGGKIFETERVVVTQPSAGQFKAFSAVCTHAGCVVATVRDGTINCPCHGSKFGIADGSVQHGPARRPLPSRQVTVTGDTITVS
ncbi:MAG TPA: Rieske (2Fe-2S) protein [Micromonosporaceae bacterium]